MSEQEKLQRQKDFEELSKTAETFINKWGCPHSVIIIRQGNIELFESEIAKPLKILD